RFDHVASAMMDKAAVSQLGLRDAGMQAAIAQELVAPMKAQPAPVAPLCQAYELRACGVSIQHHPTYPLSIGARGVSASMAAAAIGDSCGRAAVHASRSRSPTVARRPPAGAKAPVCHAFPSPGSAESGRSPLLVIPSGASTLSRVRSQNGAVAAAASAC